MNPFASVYASWWIGNGQDQALFSTTQIRMYFTMIHMSLGLGIALLLGGSLLLWKAQQGAPPEPDD